MAYDQILNFNQINNEPRINKKKWRVSSVVEYILGYTKYLVFSFWGKGVILLGITRFFRDTE